MIVYDVNGNKISDGAVIKPYYADEMEDTVSKVRALQTEPNLTFFMVTDIHAYFVEGAETLYKTSIENMRGLIEQIPCDGVINLGDSIEGYSTAEIAKNYGSTIVNEFRKIGLPYFSAIGNHDNNHYHNNTTAERLTAGMEFSVFNNATRNVTFDSTGFNFFVDFPEFNIRAIFLDSVSNYTYEYTSDTVSWFSTVALDTPTGYGVILCTHVAPVGAWNYNNTTPTRSADIVNALDTYAASKDVIAVLCGHNHVDGVFSSPYNGFTMCCEKFENENGNPSLWPSGSVKPQRTLGTASEDCWTVAVVRPGSRKINFVRFGAGLDYEISY